MACKCVNFIPEHGQLINGHQTHHQELGVDASRLDHWQEIADQGIARTIVCDGKPVAIGGVSLVEAKRNYIYFWAVLSKNMSRSMIFFFRRTKELIQEVHAMGYPVIVCNVRDEYKEGKRLAEMLGFKRSNSSFKHHGLNLTMYLRSQKCRA